MFTNAQRQVERTGRGGTPRDQYLQDLVTQFQDSTDEGYKERIVANLSNFAYDPYNYAFMRQLNILELFLDCITEPNERLVEFGVGGICNSCVDPANASVITQCGGIPLVVQCLSSPVKNTVSVSEPMNCNHNSIGLLCFEEYFFSDCFLACKFPLDRLGYFG
uniref:Armadillo repeat-containing protein 7 n=1 Tax=Triticum urartu TaxID=4572 RepID=A0A8R7P0J4_TRIUA